MLMQNQNAAMQAAGVVPASGVPMRDLDNIRAQRGLIGNIPAVAPAASVGVAQAAIAPGNSATSPNSPTKAASLVPPKEVGVRPGTAPLAKQVGLAPPLPRRDMQSAIDAAPPAVKVMP